MILRHKLKKAGLRQKQNWNMAQIKGLKLIVQENYAFTADNKFFIALGVKFSSKTITTTL